MKLGLIGWYGHANAGDERILECLRRQFPDDERVVVGSLDDAMRRIDELNGCDFVLLGGGGLVLRRFGRFARLFEDLTVPFGCVGLGIEARHADNRDLIDVLEERAEFLYVRDRASLGRLDRRFKAIVAPDLTFLAPFDVAEWEAEPRCAMNLRPWRSWGLEYQGHADRAMRWLNERLPGALVPTGWDPASSIAMVRSRMLEVESCPLYTESGRENDASILRSFFEDVPAAFAPEQIATNNYFVGMRLHGLIFSCQMGIPFLSLSYQPKNEAFCADLGLEKLSIPLGHDDALESSLDFLLAEGREIRSSLLDRRSEYEAQARTLMNGIERLIRSLVSVNQAAPNTSEAMAVPPVVRSPEREEAPLVSIVLPVFNGERFLAESIRSCVNQSHRNWELLIVDDFSSDRSPEIAREFAELDPRIRVFRNDRNQKLPNSLNSGFSRASGDYLTWTSDDNRFESSALEALVARLESMPATDIVYSNYSIIDSDGEIIRHRRTPPPDEILIGNCVGPCFLMRRSVFGGNNRFDPSRFLVEDYEFWLKTSINHEIAKVEEDLYRYRVHPGSLSERHEAKIKRLHYGLVREYLPKLTLVPVLKKREAMEAALNWSLANSLRAESTRLLVDYTFRLGLRPRARFVAKCVLRLLLPKRWAAEIARIRDSGTGEQRV
jgi:glycosyltransferase involved in cell wall biosynthesis/polysaccharide pyruvyl transferase WcaK-like protein